MSNSHSLSFVNGSMAKVIMAYIFAEEIAARDQKLSTASQFFSNGVCIKKKNTYNTTLFYISRFFCDTFSTIIEEPSNYDLYSALSIKTWV